MIDGCHLTMKTTSAVALLLLLPLLDAFADDHPLVPRIDEETDRVPLHTVVPMYPDTARRDRIEGDVQVCYNVDRKGRPYRVAVRSSTNRLFERPALRAVRASTYVALQDGEESSGIKTCRTFRFRLEPDEND